jgi:hypothetical protein
MEKFQFTVKKEKFQVVANNESEAFEEANKHIANVPGFYAWMPSSKNAFNATFGVWD